MKLKLNKKSAALGILMLLGSGSALAQSDPAAADAFVQLATEFALYLTAGFGLLGTVMVGFTGVKWLRMFVKKST